MKQDIAKQIIETIDSKSKEIIDFALDLVKIPSETPPGNEKAVASLIMEKAKIWGLPEPEILCEKPDRPNLIYKIKGKSSKKVLILNGHIDTKPIGEADKWKRINPYKPEIIDDKLYGRGSTDMKGGVAGIIAAAMAILKCKASLGGNLMLVLTSDEEGGCMYGANVIIKKGLKGNAMIIAEPSGIDRDFDNLGLACRGVAAGKIVVHGTQMHSSLSDNGYCVNASVKMAKVLIEFSENLKKYLHYDPHHLYPNGPTVTVGTLNEDIYFPVTVVPGIASFIFDIRIIPGMKAEDIKKDVENFLKALKEKDKDLQVEVIWKKPLELWTLPVEISPDNPLVSSCVKTTEEIIGIKPNLMGVPFSTDGCYFGNKLKIEVIPSFGPGFIRIAHGPDEFVNVKAILDAAKIFAISSIRYLNF